LMEEKSFYFDRYETDINYLVFAKRKVI